MKELSRSFEVAHHDTAESRQKQGCQQGDFALYDPSEGMNGFCQCFENMPYTGLLVTARYFAKWGELWRSASSWQGGQDVPGDYARASIRSDTPCSEPGSLMIRDCSFSLGHDYWCQLPADALGVYSVFGVYKECPYEDVALA